MRTFLFTTIICHCAMANLISKNTDSDFVITKKNFEVKELLVEYAKIQQASLIMDEVPKSRVSLAGPRIINQADLKLFVSAAAEEANLTIIPHDKLNHLQVINTRDIRYSGGILHKDISTVEDTYTYTMVMLKPKYIEVENLVKSLRPFMSRYGRMVEDRNTNSLILSDTGKNLRRLEKLITSIDKPQFKARVDLLDGLNKKGVVEIEQEVSFLDYLESQYVLFILAFSLIGGILGFGIRGYLMKRIEGGW